MLNDVLKAFGLDPELYIAEKFGNGLIHATFLLKSEKGKEFILQEINHAVFKHPEDIAWNLGLIGNYLSHFNAGYFLPLSLPTAGGEPFLKHMGKYFRLTPYVAGSHALNSCKKADEAFEAANQFGKFTSVLNGIDTGLLRYPIPGFHNLPDRWKGFSEAINTGDRNRYTQLQSQEVIGFLFEQKRIVDEFERISANSFIPLRVIHHDTKISNILFDKNEKGICVIDLDTVMPGYFISDLGDMMRTYLSLADEEEKDLSKIIIRPEFFSAIVKGYLQNMGEVLSRDELECFYYSGEFMIYMQALRFMTDHLNNDRYYGARYEDHNLFRALNQATLLKEYQKLEPEFRSIINQLSSF